MKELPIYDITIEDDAEIQGVSKISLVDVPAIGVNWIALRKVELKLQDVFGYETQHFDICPGAQNTFENYSKMQLDEDTIGMIRSAAQNADNVFEIEKRVVAEGKATSQDLEQVKTLVSDFKDIIAEIDKITNQPQNVDYMDGHIKVVEDLLPKTIMAVRKKKPKMSFAKKECLGCPPNGDGTRVNGEPDRRCKGDGAEKTPKAGGGRGKASAKASAKTLNEKMTNSDKSISLTRDEYNEITKTMRGSIEEKIGERTLDGYEVMRDYAFLSSKDGEKSSKFDPEVGAFVEDVTTFQMVKDYKSTERNRTEFEGKQIGTITRTCSDPTGRDLLGNCSFDVKFKDVTDKKAFFDRIYEGKTKPMFKKQTFAKKECLGCPPNGDGTRVNGEPDKRCKGDGAGKTPKAGGGKASAKPAGKKSAEKKSEVAKSKITPPLNISPELIKTDPLGSTATFDTLSREQIAYWQDENNVNAVKEKGEELKSRQEELSKRSQAFNEKLAQYPMKNGNYMVPPSERESLNAERTSLQKDVDQWKSENAVQMQATKFLDHIETEALYEDKPLKQALQEKEGTKATDTTKTSKSSYNRKLGLDETKKIMEGSWTGYDINEKDDFVYRASVSSDMTQRISDYEKDLQQSGLTNENFGIKDAGEKHAQILSGETVKLTEDELKSLMFKVKHTAQERDGRTQADYKFVRNPKNPDELHVQRTDGWAGSNILTINTKEGTIKTNPYRKDSEGNPVKIPRNLMGTDKPGGINYDNNPFYMEAGFLLGGRRLPSINHGITPENYGRNSKGGRNFKIYPYSIR